MMEFIAGFLVGTIIYIIIDYIQIFKNIKVDFSTTVKENKKKLGVLASYSIYVRKNIFHKWEEYESCASLDRALRDAKTLSMKPKYF